MNTPELLAVDDRCRRSAHFSLIWDKPKLRPLDILRISVDDALVCDDEDPGDYAGARVMELCSMRQIETKELNLYDMGCHTAALADILTTVLRGPTVRLERPADEKLGEHVWVSSCFLEPSGVRLRRLIILDRISEEILTGIKRSWDVIGEACAYKMPVTAQIVIVGQQRDGRRLAPWSKGWLHQVGNQNLRFRKQDGSGLTGSGWKPVFREQVDYLSRDYWIDRMKGDGVLQDLMLEIEIPVPLAEIVKMVTGLAKKKLDRIYSTEKTPEPEISQCYGNVPCPFTSACWQFQEPSERLGFIRISS